MQVGVTLGEVAVGEEISESQMKEFGHKLENIGFEILDDRRTRLVEQVKIHIRELVHLHNGNLKVNLSEYLSEKTHLEYSYLSGLFSEMEGRTVEKYFIFQKIERVKELLVYDDMQLSEIAYLMNYSSVAHLSSQFKKVTGLTPSKFKQMGIKLRNPLDKL